MVVSTIRYAVVITVTITVDPASTVQAPATVDLFPLRRVEGVAGPCTLPMAFAPDVLAAVPVPEAWRPFISVPRGWRAFMARLRRSHANCTDMVLSKRLNWNENRASDE